MGPQPAVADADLTRAADALKQSLNQDAQSALTSQIPAGYAPIPGTLQVNFSPLEQTPGDGTTAIISESATMTGAILLASDLAATIAKQKVDGYNGEAVAFADIADLTVAAATTTKPGDAITLNLSGSPTIIWQFDPTALKAALVGKSKANFESIVESFQPAISRAEAKIRPFWQSSFRAIRRK